MSKSRGIVEKDAENIGSPPTKIIRASCFRSPVVGHVQDDSQSEDVPLFDDIGVDDSFAISGTSLDGVDLSILESFFPGSDIKCPLGTSFFGLPLSVKELLFKLRGISSLYAWQEECLSLPCLSQRRNLIYSCPTSGGKTLVAELLMMKEVLMHRRSAVYVVPFISIVNEKVLALTPFGVELGFHVEEYAGSRGRYPPRKRRKRCSIYVATIEKANGILSSLIENGRQKEIGMVVVDELHMIGENGGRGATLEMAISKVLHYGGDMQVVGMSATLSNIKDLLLYLGAELYMNNHRPVDLMEHMVVNGDVYSVEPSSAQSPTHDRIKYQRKLKATVEDPDGVSSLVAEVVPEHSCLVFCSTKKHCESLSIRLAEQLQQLVPERCQEARASLLRGMQLTAGGLCPNLRRTIPRGVAYHHSGLTMEERKVIEEAYLAGTLTVLCCTSTLAAGINLPARRVIIRSPYVGSQFLSTGNYKQMIGRAGRAGMDTIGESYLIIKASDEQKASMLLQSVAGACISSLLGDEGKHVRTLVLTVIGLQMCRSLEDVTVFFGRTLAHHQWESLNMLSTPREYITDIVQGLIQKGFLKELPPFHPAPEETPFTLGSKIYTVNNLGQAAFKGGLDLDLSVAVYNELQKAQDHLYLNSDLHLLFLVTPHDNKLEVTDWMFYYQKVSRLNSRDQKAATVVGITESYLCRRVSGMTSAQDPRESLYRRFYGTLILLELSQQESVWSLSQKYGVPRGHVNSLVSSACCFASMLVHYTQELEEFWGLRPLFEKISEKLSLTSTAELLPLMEITAVKYGRARQLLKAGYTSLSAVARADPARLVAQIEHLTRQQANLIVSSAKLLLQEKIEALSEQAEELLGGLVS